MSDYAKFQEEHTRERIAAIASSLRRMADEVERDAKTALTLDSAVSGAIHTVQWGFANLNLSILVDNLSRYHDAVLADTNEDNAMNRAEQIERMSEAFGGITSTHWADADKWERDTVREGMARALAVFGEAHAKPLATSPERVKIGADFSHIEEDAPLYPDLEKQDKTGKTPSDDEREALIFAWAEYRKEYEPNPTHFSREAVAFRAGWDAALHRTVQGEPEREHFHIWSEIPCKPGQCRMEPQGEPSDDYEAGYAEGFHHGRSTPREPQGEPFDDEAIHNAMDAQQRFLNPDSRSAMRAALRAAETGGER